MLINGIKFACNTCVKGHRSSNCNHIERPLFEIRKKGRPVTQCAFCRDLRKTRQIHIKCTCTDKTKNIENTAIQCYQCPSTSKVLEEQGIAYSDLIQSSFLNNNSAQDDPIQCTCHEAANKILQQENYTWAAHQQQEQTPISPSRPRGMIIEDSSSPGFSSKSSFRFLGGQTKCPRRRSSASSKKRSNHQQQQQQQQQQKQHQHHQQQKQQQQQDGMMVDMQSFLFNQQRSTEIETDRSIAFPSNSTSSTSTPNSNYNTILAEEKENRYSDHDIGLMMSTTNADELTSLLNNVLNNNKRQQEEDEEIMNTMDASTNQQIMATDMARSTTTNSFSSSSSNAGNFIVPQQQHIVCGSFTPHSNCSPAIDTQGESVVITITPLSTLFTSDEEHQDKMHQTNKPVTRIVTCYCGNSCICPGCFVHPSNYIQQHQQYNMQQQQYMQIQQTSSNSSSYSSDDEDQHHHLNYTATDYSLL